MTIRLLCPTTKMLCNNPNLASIQSKQFPIDGKHSDCVACRMISRHTSIKKSCIMHLEAKHSKINLEAMPRYPVFEVVEIDLWDYSLHK